MRLHEYEGKELFQEMEIRIPKAKLVSSMEEILKASEDIGFPLVIKAQVLYGGRGKAGLVRKARNIEELTLIANELISSVGVENKFLIEEQILAIDEIYVGITIDDVLGIPVLVISKKGGVDIENIVQTEPQLIAREYINPQNGLYYHRIVNAIKKAGFKGNLVKELADFTEKLYKVFIYNEADTVESNPILVLENNKLIAGDAKVILDDYATFRNKSNQKYNMDKEHSENNPKVIYVQLNGNIGIISLGASNTMMLIDSIKFLGGEPANFCDIASGVNQASVYNLTRYVLEQSKNNMKVILINVTLSGASLKTVIEGIVEAINSVEIASEIPIYANVRANGAARLDMSLKEAAAKLMKSGVRYCQTLEQAIDQVIQISKL